MNAAFSLKDEAGSCPGEPKQAYLDRRAEVLLIALPSPFADTLVTQASDIGQACTALADTDSLAPELNPRLVVTNLDVPAGLDQITSLRNRFDTSDIVAITNVPCVIRIAQAVRRGASIVMARPTTLAQIMAAVAHPNLRPPTPDPMSLDRAIWEFLNQAVLEAGSISGAARLLRLDRTSLKRMLRKVPGS